MNAQNIVQKIVQDHYRLSLVYSIEACDLVISKQHLGVFSSDTVKRALVEKPRFELMLEEYDRSQGGDK